MFGWKGRSAARSAILNFRRRYSSVRFAGSRHGGASAAPAGRLRATMAVCNLVSASAAVIIIQRSLAVERKMDDGSNPSADQSDKSETLLRLQDSLASSDACTDSIWSDYALLKKDSLLKHLSRDECFMLIRRFALDKHLVAAGRCEIILQDMLSRRFQLTAEEFGLLFQDHVGPKWMLHWLKVMKKVGVQPSKDIYESVLSRCCTFKDVRRVLDIMDRMKASGLTVRPHVFASVVALLAGENHLDKAEDMIAKAVMKDDPPSAAAFSVLIISLLKANQSRRAEKLFLMMKECGRQPDEHLSEKLESCLAGMPYSSQRLDSFDLNDTSQPPPLSLVDAPSPTPQSDSPLVKSKPFVDRNRPPSLLSVPFPTRSLNARQPYIRAVAYTSAPAHHSLNPYEPVMADTWSGGRAPEKQDILDFLSSLAYEGQVVQAVALLGVMQRLGYTLRTSDWNVLLRALHPNGNVSLALEIIDLMMSADSVPDAKTAELLSAVLRSHDDLAAVSSWIERVQDRWFGNNLVLELAKERKIGLAFPLYTMLESRGYPFKKRTIDKLINELMMQGADPTALIHRAVGNRSKPNARTYIAMLRPLILKGEKQGLKAVTNDVQASRIQPSDYLRRFCVDGHIRNGDVDGFVQVVHSIREVNTNLSRQFVCSLYRGFSAFGLWDSADKLWDALWDVQYGLDASVVMAYVRGLLRWRKTDKERVAKVRRDLERLGYGPLYLYVEGIAKRRKGNTLS
ncbi:hypothetical protein DFJ73DRAFT_821161 [Zopfochytrium polystomum]|nr:hypothetical protein DFJ73DRAFT_821161 [Zopfochytrium polystomum]